MSGNYCSQKFWFLSVNVERQITNSCCNANSVNIDKVWLSNNTGQLFNTPILKKERMDLLQDKRVASCDSCWSAEDRGLLSRRIAMNSNVRTHESLDATPSMLNIVIGTDCNMTCSYCCKQYSSAWANDLVNNGSYPVVDVTRYSMSPQDMVLHKISQKEIMQSPTRSLIMDEVGLLESEYIIISGGEPFLNLGLSKLVNSIKAKSIQISSGLGVNNTRFENELVKIKSIPNVQIVVSAENIGDMYEFNRYGNTYENFLKNLELIKKHNIPVSFLSTMSNITLFGFDKFVKEFADHEIQLNVCTDPDYLAVNVMDDESKQMLIDTLPKNFERMAGIIDSISKPYTETQKTELAKYINEFAKRRNLSLNIFPTSFTEWLSK